MSDDCTCGKHVGIGAGGRHVGGWTDLGCAVHQGDRPPWMKLDDWMDENAHKAHEGEQVKPGVDDVRWTVEDIRREREEQLLKQLGDYRTAVEDIKTVIGNRLLAAVEDDDMGAAESFAFGQITGILTRVPKAFGNGVTDD